MHCERGDVVLVMFPDSNQASAKRRPALVVGANDLDTGIAQTVVAMVTSNLERVGHPSRVLVERESERGKQMGILMDSVIMTDNVATVREYLIDRRVGHLDDMSAVDEALRHSLGL